MKCPLLATTQTVQFFHAPTRVSELKGVETAILRPRGAHIQGRKATVILDLKAAYQGVLHDKLMERLHVKVYRSLANQINVILSTNLLHTV